MVEQDLTQTTRMAFEQKNRLELRRLFEVQLADALKVMARRPLEFGDKAIPEFPPTFRAGFKWALILIGLIKESTTELTDEQLRMFCERHHEILNLPPPPEQQLP